MVKEINFIRPQEVYDRNTGESKVRYRSYDGNDRFIPVMEGENGVPKTLVEVTHAELKAMRDAGKLTPGALYRITDYQCTTTQENTQSAGHQFDIVLLALSEDKLAEEGWAMISEAANFAEWDLYTITFADTVVRQMYYRKYKVVVDSDDLENVIIDSETLKGFNAVDGVFDEIMTLDSGNNTGTCVLPYSEAVTYLINNYTEYNYNYFQNSNLSAWKVWYCLDNDTARFAWADDSVDGGSPASIQKGGFSDVTYTRNLQNDTEYENVQYYAWEDTENNTIYTTSETPQIGDSIYGEGKGGAIEATENKVSQFTPAHEGTGLPNGRGVIYRLVDEWNNDVGYDFKNIQFIRPMTDGVYDADNGTDTWCYTFNRWDSDNSACVDATTGITLGFNDVNNNIAFIENLGDNVFLGECNDIKIMDANCGLITLSNCLSTTLIATYIFELADENGAIYIANKKVLTEE